ncbi:hypothetical protein [Streptomyces showdoensis]|uniref:Uncharacterized protein n=1 Tax=Streptomyces showdoensis TaxID=68268 RepID=A0A2P2GS51_STREW|nr:hypothetical protein [Streptomyces showdoensis]KKZ74317.1 hypothetical protein VO63_07665 [Streptomyces showdoensis]
MNEDRHTCPGCGRDDLVQAVPAVYLAGRNAVTSRERDADGDLRTVTRTSTTALADALAPVPPKPSRGLAGLGLLAGLLGLGAFLGRKLAGTAEEAGFPDGGYVGAPDDLAQDTGPDLAFLGWTAALALAVVVLVVVLLLYRGAVHARRTAGRHQAEELWSQGWYCHRCGTVHFLDVPGEDRAPLTLQRFRERVWERGGYGALAARHPVSGR